MSHVQNMVVTPMYNKAADATFQTVNGATTTTTVQQNVMHQPMQPTMQPMQQQMQAPVMMGQPVMAQPMGQP